MMLRRISFAIGLMASVISGAVSAQSQVPDTATQHIPSVPEFIHTIANAHPYLQLIEQKGVKYDASLVMAESEFDIKLEQDVAMRLTGYYDGNQVAQRAVKPLAGMNAKLYTEYRVAGGNFPVYEQQMDTLTGGEASIGVSLSLLRNRETDSRRTALTNARVAIEQWQAEASLMRNDFIFKGLSQYLKWYEATLKIATVHDLIDTLHARRKGLQARVDNGDLPAVTLTEFDASILEQQLALATLEQSRQVAVQSLSFFWQVPGDSTPFAAQHNVLGLDIDWPFSLNQTYIQQLRTALRQHPVIQARAADVASLTNEQRLAKNQLLPTLDMKAAVAQDFGSGPVNLEDTETKVALQFSYPLGNRKAKAKLSKADAELAASKLELNLAEQKLRQEFEQAVVQWEQSQRVAQLQQQNTKVKEELSWLEQQRFEKGDSDLFKLNARASQVMNARLKNVEAVINAMYAELSLHWVAARLGEV